MAFLQFNEDVYSKTVETGEEVRLGSFTTATDGQLASIRVWLSIDGVTSFAGSETITLNVYNNSSLEAATLMFSSSPSEITADLLGATTDYWLGFLRTDFNRENINANQTYHVTATFQNYTEGAVLFGLNYDYPLPWYDTPGATTFFQENIAFQIFMYEEP